MSELLIPSAPEMPEYLTVELGKESRELWTRRLRFGRWMPVILPHPLQQSWRAERRIFRNARLRKQGIPAVGRSARISWRIHRSPTRAQLVRAPIAWPPDPPVL